MTTTATAPKTGLTGSGLTLSFTGKPVVREASISIVPGKITALIGPNGSGKSTLLRSLARLHRPDSGTVGFTDGTDSRTLSSREFATRVSLLSQGRPVPGGVTVREVVEYGRHPHRPRWGAKDTNGAAVISHVLELTRTAALADRPVEALSGGQLQRVWLASCLAQDTGVLLLDEPTTYLDLRYQVEILDLVCDLASAHGVAIGIVLHDLDQAAAIADTVVLLEGGSIKAAGTPAAVLTEENLSQAFGIQVEVRTDPDTGHLSTRALGTHNTATRNPVAAPISAS